MLVGTHDFSCFEKVGADNKTSVCTVSEAYWKAYVPTHLAICGSPGQPSAAGRWAGLPTPEIERFPGAPVNVPQGAPSTGIARPYDALALPGAAAGEEVPSYWYFRISADRFLRNMVRAIVGTLIEVGRGKRTLDDFAGLILPADTPSAKSKGPVSGPQGADCTGIAFPKANTNLRSMAGESVPGHALFLSKVEY